MRKQLSSLFLTFVIGIILQATILVIPTHAQGSSLTPTPAVNVSLTPTPTLASTPTSTVAQFVNPNLVTLSQLKKPEMQLTGPYDGNGFSLSIPADWELKEGAQLNLFVGVAFSTGDANQSDVIVVGGGTLSVFLNNETLAVLPLNTIGESEIKIPIPLTALNSDPTDNGRMDFYFILESGTSCRISGQQTVVIIHPTSYFVLPHNTVQASTSLLNFPRPILQESFMPDSALVIVPDQPSPAELQAALTVAAGMGNFSGNEMLLDMTTLSKFKAELGAKNHIIFVGKAASLPVLGQLQLPLPAVNGQFQIPEGSPDDGLIEMVNSPWSNTSHVILIVSANTDQGIVKAARAVSTGVIRSNRFENLAVIEQVNLVPVSSPQEVDQTLADLGYGERSLQSRGYSSQDYIFNIPRGMTVSQDAYFELVYGHTALVNYNSSQIVLSINDIPIGSVRMSDATASLPTNRVKIMIPPAAVLPGKNRLSLTVNLEPNDECFSPNQRGMWVNIWPESTLHLPIIATSLTSVAPKNIADYPAPFIYNYMLGDTAFVLEKNDLESWRKALQIASYLGDQANGPLTALTVFYGDGMPATERSKYNLIVMGRPSQMPIMSEMNDDLPAPFLIGSDIANESNNFQVEYRIPSDSPLGYIETMLSPWNSNNVILAILGNTTQGVNWAASALIDPVLRSNLQGNLAVVNDRQIITTNTLFSVTTVGEIGAVEIPADAAVPQEVNLAQAPASRPLWILPVMVLSIVVIALIVLLVILRNRSLIRARANANIQKTGHE